nr:transcriptional regulator prz1 [Quercus suber]
MAYFERRLRSSSQHSTPTMQLDQSFRDTMPSSAQVCGKAQDDWVPMSNPCGEDFLPTTTCDAPMWQPAEAPQGLGLTFPQANQFQQYDGIVQNLRYVAMPYWTPDWTVSQASTSDSSLVRKDSWNHGCDPTSTLLAPVWDPLDQTTAALDFDASSLSSCSGSPHTSAASSPHAYPETTPWVVGSPAIKTEDHASPPNTYGTCLHERSVANRSLLVGPLDLLAQSKSENEHLMTRPIWNACTPSDHASTCEDYKPAILSQHGSLQDEEMEEKANLKVLEVRPKRQFTNAGNAVCRCEECGLLFRRRYNMKAHMKTRHTNQTKPHACHHADCQWGFHRRTDLTRHLRTAKDHACPLCRGRFARKDTLQRYFQIHVLSFVFMIADFYVPRHVDDGCPKRSEVRRRTLKARHHSNDAFTPKSENEWRFGFKNGEALLRPEQRAEKIVLTPKHWRCRQHCFASQPFWADEFPWCCLRAALSMCLEDPTMRARLVVGCTGPGAVRSPACNMPWWRGDASPRRSTNTSLLLSKPPVLALGSQSLWNVWLDFGRLSELLFSIRVIECSDLPASHQEVARWPDWMHDDRRLGSIGGRVARPRAHTPVAGADESSLDSRSVTNSTVEITLFADRLPLLCRTLTSQVARIARGYPHGHHIRAYTRL